MRAPLLAIAAVALLALSGCAGQVPALSGAVTEPRGDAQDASARAAVSAAKIAVTTALIDDPSALPSVAELSDYGYAPDAETGAAVIRGTAADFCVEVASLSGTVFHATYSGSVTEGTCP